MMLTKLRQTRIIVRLRIRIRIRSFVAIRRTVHMSIAVFSFGVITECPMMRYPHHVLNSFGSR